MLCPVLLVFKFFRDGNLPIPLTRERTNLAIHDANEKHGGKRCTQMGLYTDVLVQGCVEALAFRWA